jgi:hypothetical protein
MRARPLPQRVWPDFKSSVLASEELLTIKRPSRILPINSGSLQSKEVMPKDIIAKIGTNYGPQNR